MALLSRYRRSWAYGIIAVLVLPAFGHFLPDMPAPPPPVTWLGGGYWRRAAEQVDPFINSWFGFRGVFIAAHRELGRISFKQGPVLLGEEGQLFYMQNYAVEKALGLFSADETEIDNLERVVRKMAASQLSRGGQFLMTSPPDGATIQAELLPQWLRVRSRKPTGYDLVMNRLNANGLNLLDLRPVLLKAKAEGPVYFRTDTHWNARGNLLAFNATMRALGRTDLTFDPSQVLGPLQRSYTGDLARLTGQKQKDDDFDYPFSKADEAQKSMMALPDTGSKPNFRFSIAPYAFATHREEPSIMVVGDSFAHRWRELMALKFSRVAWIHSEWCDFDWGWIDSLKPDILIFAPTERDLGCKRMPYGFPARTALPDN